MSLLVTGSIGIDTVTTPHGQADSVLGGTAVYFSFAATQYVPVRLVAVVGDDFPDEFRQILGTRDIDLAGLEVRSGSSTFRWTGRFEGDMNVAETLDVKLNVLTEKHLRCRRPLRTATPSSWPTPIPRYSANYSRSSPARS